MYRGSLDGIPSPIAVLDPSGRVVLVNRAWDAYARARDPAGQHPLGVGANYLQVCRNAKGDAHADGALAAIESVLNGTLPHFEMEYPCHSPTEQRWFVMTVVPIQPGSARGAVISHLDITLNKEAAQALEGSERRFQAMFDKAAVGIAEVAPNGKWLRVNEQLRRTLGYSPEAMGLTSYTGLTHPEDVDMDTAQQEVLCANAADSYSVDKRLLRSDGTWVWVNAAVSCVRKQDAGIDYFVVIIEDISERKLAERRQGILLREVAHRGNNLLAVIQSIASLSLSGHCSLQEAEQALIGRLHALAQTYDILTNREFNGAPLEDVLRNELAAFGERARVAGPAVVLTPKAAQTFALVVHELGTNAIKYGALTVPHGRVAVDWELLRSADDRTIRFEWREEGGPPAAMPLTFGFGTTLLDVVAGQEFGCQPALSYTPDGFRYQFECSLARIGSELTASPVRRRLVSPVMCGLYDSWARHRGTTDGLPPLTGFDWARFAASGRLTMATVEPGGVVRFAQVGRALIAEMDQPSDDGLAAFSTDRLTEAYLRCAERREPTHELLRFDFGDDDPLSFERLLVPFSATGGHAVTHVVGLSVFQGHTRSAVPAGAALGMRPLGP